MCKLLAIVVALTLQLAALTHAGVGMGQGFILAMPLLVGSILWETARSVTRRQHYMDPGFFWYGIPLFIGLAALADAFNVWFGASTWFFAPWHPLVLVLVGVMGVVVSFLMSALRFARRRWIGSRIVQRARAMGMDIDGVTATAGT